ncbi:MAG: hypothetical protein IKF71_03445 [Bacilli bacterium]|nr:hypothetical protein [Bacilli bacterium]
MSNEIDETTSIDSLLQSIESGFKNTQTLRSKIKSLEVEFPVQGDVSLFSTVSQGSSYQEEETVDSFDDYRDYLDDYLKFSGETAEELSCIMPSRDDYHYEDILLRLHAESLKVMKEIVEYSYEDPTIGEDAQELVAREKHKINLLQQLLTMEDEVSDEKPEFNKIILVPNKSGNIRVLEELEMIPREYYSEVYQLMGTIIKGTFKRIKRLTRGTNASLIGGATEVRGTKIRILFQRLNHDTYAVFSVFMKKTTNDSGLQNQLRTRIREFKDMENEIRANLSNSEFMEMNEDNLLELWNKLGYSEAPKTYRKDIS